MTTCTSEATKIFWKKVIKKSFSKCWVVRGLSVDKTKFIFKNSRRTFLKDFFHSNTLDLTNTAGTWLRFLCSWHASEANELLQFPPTLKAAECCIKKWSFRHHVQQQNNPVRLIVSQLLMIRVNEAETHVRGNIDFYFHEHVIVPFQWDSKVILRPWKIPEVQFPAAETYCWKILLKYLSHSLDVVLFFTPQLPLTHIKQVLKTSSFASLQDLVRLSWSRGRQKGAGSLGPLVWNLTFS